MSLLFIGYKILNVFRINRKIDIMLTSIEKVNYLILIKSIGYDTCLGICVFCGNSNDRNDNHSCQHLGSLYDRVQEFLWCLSVDTLFPHGPFKLRVHAILQCAMGFFFRDGLHYLCYIHPAFLIHDLFHWFLQKSHNATWLDYVVADSRLRSTLATWPFPQ